MRRLGGALIGLASITAYIALAGIPAFGDESGTVTVTVTAQAPLCITVGESSIDYGPLPFSTEDEMSTALSNPFAVTNCGVDLIDVEASTTPFSDGGSQEWLVGSTPECDAPPDLDQAALNVSINSFDDFFLNGTPQTVIADLDNDAPNNSAQARFELTMPCHGSVGLGATFSAQVLFTALAP